MSDSKHCLRQRYRLIRDGFDKEFIDRASSSACEKLIKTKEFECADTVLMYYPINGELSPLKVFDFCIGSGKKVAFPVCRNEDNSLIFRQVSSLAQLQAATLEIPEPTDDRPSVTPNERTLCIVPAIALGKNGERLGYGGGYYDKFLADFVGKSAGFVYSELVTDDIPQEKFDVKLDMIITESEVHYVAQKN